MSKHKGGFVWKRTGFLEVWFGLNLESMEVKTFLYWTLQRNQLTFQFSMKYNFSSFNLICMLLTLACRKA
jgi:hypothetical protein